MKSLGYEKKDSDDVTVKVRLTPEDREQLVRLIEWAKYLGASGNLLLKLL